MTLAFALLSIALAAFGAALWVHGRSRRRARAIGALLDAADALESRLRDARAQIGAVADPAHDPVREAIQEMLRQRLWLQRHGGEASLAQLARVRGSIDAARDRIDQQLLLIERARAAAR